MEPEVDPAQLLADTDLQDLAAAMRTEWQAEYEEAAGEARMQWEHGRTLIDRLHDAMARGDVLAFEASGSRFVGSVVNLGTEWCTVDAPAGTVDIHLSGAAHAGVIIRQVERGRSGGRRAPQPPMSFRARCYELEMERVPVCVGAAGADVAFVGALVVGKDHIEVSREGTAVWIPLNAVRWITLEQREH